MAVYSYKRVSTDIQEKKETYRTQDFLIHQKAQELNLHIDEEFSDLNYSGKDMNRPDLQSLLDLLIMNPGSTLLVMDQDRLTRDPADWLVIQSIFLESNTTVIGIESPIDISTDEGQLVGEIKASLNKYFRNKTKRKVKAGIKRYRDENNGQWGPKPKIKDSLFQHWYYKRDIKNKTQLAKILGVSRKTLYNYMQKKNIDLKNEMKT